MEIQTNVPASSVLRGANHVVFVEGNDDNTFDPTVIRELLTRNGLASVEVHAIGPCENVHQAAKAMVWQHPTYYFLIDRDEKSKDFVENSWNNFPTPETHNLLVWRKRELENYFIDPEYLMNSSYLIRSEAELRERILGECGQRLFMEAANLVLLSIRSEVLRAPEAWFNQVQNFTTRDDALANLVSCPGLATRFNDLQATFELGKREVLLDQFLGLMTGGKVPLEFGSGEWLNMISGKEIFRSVSGWAFQVRDTSNNVLNGKEQNNEVAKDLLRNDLAVQPSDFRQFYQLISGRLA